MQAGRQAVAKDWSLTNKEVEQVANIFPLAETQRKSLNGNGVGIYRKNQREESKGDCRSLGFAT